MERAAAALWGPFTLGLIMLLGLYIAVKTRFLPLIKMPSALLKTLFGEKKSKGISPVMSLSNALAATMGTGNIVGVATAVAAGGAGALFWMELSALAGMMIKYAEATLAEKYRALGAGPLGYLQRLGRTGRILSLLFAQSCVIAALGAGNMTQSNSSAQALEYLGVSPAVCAVLFVFTALWATGGGERKLMRITSRVIFVITVIYLAMAVLAIWRCRGMLPQAVGSIISGAFGLDCAVGGIGGYTAALAVRYGLSRGVFSNEAGMGTSPIAYSLSEGKGQGFLGVAEVFIDTTVCCTLTGLTLLVSGADISGADGASLAINAFSSALGNWCGVLAAVMIALFGAASVCGWYTYGKKSLEHLLPNFAPAAGVYRVLYAFGAAAGSLLSVKTIWLASDVTTGIMMLINICGLMFLANEACILSDKKR